MSDCPDPITIDGTLVCPVVLGPLVSTPAPPVILGPLVSTPAAETTAPQVDHLADTGVGVESSLLGIALLLGGALAMLLEARRNRKSTSYEEARND